MKYFYGDKNPLRVLDEIELWKHQESEHTVVIRQIVPNLETVFVEQLKNWELAFAQAEGIAVRYVEAVIRSKGVISPVLLENIKQFAIFAANQSTCFVAFLNHLIAESQAVKNNQIAITVINHIRRESEYLIGIITAALQFF
jgi:hypothetical protein